MTQTGYGPPPGTRADGISDMVILAEAIERLADAINRVADKPMAPPGGPTSGPPGPPGKTTEQKMSGKIYAICKGQNWNQADVCEQILGFAVPDTRTLNKAQLSQILDAFKEWGHG